MTQCTETDCEGRSRARGLCHKHYQRYLAAGGPKKAVVKGSPVERFHQLYEKSETGCWIWKGYIPENGTPVIGQGIKWSSARRFIYESTREKLPRSQLLWPSCSNRLCVNPDHATLKKPEVEITHDVIERKERVLAEKTKLKEMRILEAKRRVAETRRLRSEAREAAFASASRSASMIETPERDNWDHAFCAILPRGEYTIIDAEFADWFFQFPWRAYRQKGKRTEPYVVASYKGRDLRLHRVLLSCPEGMVVDHINHNPLDNRLCNLRIATVAQNCFNIRKLKSATSIFKGVTLCRRNLKWKAYIRPPHYPRHSRLTLGYFDTELEAAEAFNEAARRFHGEFACLNELGYSTAP